MSAPMPVQQVLHSSTPGSPLSSAPLPAAVRTACLIAAAKVFIGVPEQGGDNRGQMVEIFLHGVGLPAGEPWCAAFVHHVGFWSQFDPDTGRSTWPLPATGACQRLADVAAACGVLVERPVQGDLFVMWVPELARFAHTGVVIEVAETATGFACTTIEGNTNDDGSRDGWKTAVKYRRFGSGERHRFIRWTAIEVTGSAREVA
jgi:hypothetical protein